MSAVPMLDAFNIERLSSSMSSMRLAPQARRHSMRVTKTVNTRDFILEACGQKVRLKFERPSLYSCISRLIIELRPWLLW